MGDLPTWETDPEYRAYPLDSVEKSEQGYTLGCNGWSLFVADPGFAPQVGETTRYYGKGLGFPVRGVVIEGRVVYYRTPAEEQQRLADQHLEEKRRKQAAFLANKTDMDARFAALPPEFQCRIQRFRNHCSSFRWEYEGYEMSCCIDAVKIAAHLRATLGPLADDPDARMARTWEAMKAFHGLPWEQQRTAIPDLGDGHSGNTFGMACRLAALYVAAPALVEKEHAAISALVGCAACGCWHARGEGTADANP